MSAQDNMEKVLRELHVLLSKAIHMREILTIWS